MKDKVNGAAEYQIPAEYLGIISPEKLADTVLQLDTTVSDVIETGAAKEAAYGNKRELMRQRSTMETAVKLKEAEAIMQIRGAGKEAYVEIDGQRTFLTNDTARDAFRRMASGAEREELARVNGELEALSVDTAQANDAWYKVTEAAGAIKAKAAVQAALLNFLSGRGA